jgi:hypothetical protein
MAFECVLATFKHLVRTLQGTPMWAAVTSRTTLSARQRKNDIHCLLVLKQQDNHRRLPDPSGSKIWPWVPWDSEPRITVVASVSSNLAGRQNSSNSACCVFHVCYFLSLLINPEDGGDIFLRNVTLLSTDNTALYYRRWSSSIMSFSENEDGNCTLLTDVGKILPGYTASDHRREILNPTL